MTGEELNRVLADINAHIRAKPWFDFDVVECSAIRVVVQGGLSSSAPIPDIEIRFDGIFCVSLVMAWKTDTKLPVLTVLDGDEAIRFNSAYRVEVGHHLFKFQLEDNPAEFGCVIAAESVSWRCVKGGDDASSLVRCS